MGFDISSMGEAFGSSRRNDNECMAVTVASLDTSAGKLDQHWCLGRNLLTGAEVKIRLRDIGDTSRREFQDINVKAGGVIRFDQVQMEGAGAFSAHWAVVQSHSPGESVVEIAWVQPRVHYGEDRKVDKVTLEVAWPDKAVAVSDLEQLKAAMQGIFAGEGVGVPRAAVRVSVGEAAEANLVLPKMVDKDGRKVPAQPEESVQAFLAGKGGKFIGEALVAKASVHVFPVAGGITLGLQTQKRLLKAKSYSLPDKWFRFPGGEETGFAQSVVAFQQRDNGSWMFTDAKPLRVPAEVLALARLPLGQG